MRVERKDYKGVRPGKHKGAKNKKKEGAVSR